MNEAFFAQINAKASLLQEKIFDIEDLDSAAGKEKREALINRFNNETFAFDPQDPKNIVMQSLSLMGRPSNSSAFAKLKRIAKIG